MSSSAAEGEHDHHVNIRDYLADMAQERWVAHLREHDRNTQLLDQTATDLRARLNEMNEIRAQIGVERGLYATKETTDKELQSVRQRIDDVATVINERLDRLAVDVQTNANRLSNYDGRIATLGLLLIVINIIIGVILKFAVR